MSKLLLRPLQALEVPGGSKPPAAPLISAPTALLQVAKQERPNLAASTTVLPTRCHTDMAAALSIQHGLAVDVVSFQALAQAIA